MAIAALALWMGTVAVGSYLLITAGRPGTAEPHASESVSVPARQPTTAGTNPDASPAGQGRDKDRFDPPSLQYAKSEPMPGMKDLAEFAHPALAIIGLGFWVGYVLSRERLFAVISLGILLGTVAAGLSLFAVNARAARRAATVEVPQERGNETSGGGPLSFTPRLLILHAVGAALTLLFAALIAARV